MVLFVLLLVSSCNSQDVQIVKQKPSIDTPEMMPQKGTPGSGKSEKGPGGPKVFFSRIALDFHGVPTHIGGIGFLSSSAKSIQAFTQHLDNGDIPYDSRIFGLSPNGVYVVSRTGLNESTLGEYLPTSGKLNPLEAIGASRVTDFSSGGGRSAWVTKAGDAWVSTLAQAPVPIQIPAFRASKIQLVGNQKELLISGTIKDSPTSVLFSLDNLQTPILQINGVQTSASPNGYLVAYIKSNGKESALIILDRAHSQESVLARTSDQISELRWKDEALLTYRSTAADGNMGLFWIDAISGASAEIAPLHLQTAQVKSQSVVCANWNGDHEIYFADFGDRLFSIYRARFDGQTWNVELFARPGDEQSGFVCPQITNWKHL